MTRTAVTFTRSGGIAGDHDRVVIDPDGTWIRTDRTGTQSRGRLSADQIAELQRLTDDPRLARETSPPTGNAACADARTYSLSTGGRTVTYTDCSSARPTVTTQIVGLISGWTLR